MRIVYQYHRVVLRGDFANVGQRRDIAIHAENAIGDNQPSLKPRGFRQQRFQMRDIAMPINLLRRATEPASVYDTGVVERVAQNQRAFAGKHRDDTGIGGVT